jgi:PIN domain nuclease of toxin-antitoxin system
MRVLLDTQALLWFAIGDSRISAAAMAAIGDVGKEKPFSPASYWEIAIKISLGKYSLSGPYEAFLQRAIAGNGFAILAISPAHMARLITLPFYHRDPFDRLLVAAGRPGAR